MSSNVLTFLFVRVILILSFAKMEPKRINWVRSFSSQRFTSAHAGMQTNIPRREGDTYIPACIFPKSELKYRWKWCCCMAVWVFFHQFYLILCDIFCLWQDRVGLDVVTYSDQRVLVTQVRNSELTCMCKVTSELSIRAVPRQPWSLMFYMSFTL